MTGQRVGSWLVRLVVVVGLAIDAYVHLKLAPHEQPAHNGGISEIALFYAEGVVAIVVALLVLITARRWAYGLAFLVAISALAAVLASRYVEIGAIGPIPDMYEPLWDPYKITATIAEAVTVVASVVGVVLTRHHHEVHQSLGDNTPKPMTLN